MNESLLSFAPRCCVALMALVACPAPDRCVAQEPADRPHVLVILVDDLGYGDLSSYGAQDLRTPGIDRLVERGVRMDSFYANSPVCSPTRAALLSGRYPDLVGVPGVIRTHAENNWGYLSPAPLLPALLKQGSYHTALVGKWHLGLEPPNTPTERGFDFFHGFLGDMMDDYYDHRRHGIDYMRRGTETINPQGHATDLFTQWAIDYLNSRKDQPQPFFLYLAYNAPHTPIQPPPDWLDKVRQRQPALSDERARLVALIEHLDAGIGRVLEALEKNGQADNTLVIFTSDNGGQLNVGANCGNLRGGKQDLYEGGIRVPLAAVWPGRIPPGSRSDAIGLTMDLFPTICEAAGVAVEEPIDGRSLLAAWQGQPAKPRGELVWMRREGGLAYNGQDYYAVRRGPWKLVHNQPFAPLELYHLGDDPLEQHNRAAENRAVFNDLSRLMRLHLQRAGAVPWQKPAE